MDKNWYVLAVKPRKENYVFHLLHSSGRSVAYPRYKKYVRHARTTKCILAPLFPGYLFVELEENGRDWREVNWTPGCMGFVKFANRPSPVNPRFAEHFISGQNFDGIGIFQENLKIGDRVQAVGGPFDRLIGEVIEMSDTERVKVLMNALNRKIETTLPKSTVVIAA